jgi:cation-transporting ATPase 13A1
LVVEGITGINENVDELLLPNCIPKETSYVLASAHALVILEDGIIGDPMEKNTLESIQWELKKGDKVSPMNSKNIQITIHRRFPFSSALKRMSTVSTLLIGSTRKVLISCKGAPETLRSMFITVPKGYDEHYKYWARRGKRVLALGYKYENIETKDIKDLHRISVEDKLHFAGFLIFYCPLKEDSKDAIKMLNESSHRVLCFSSRLS